MNEEEITLTEEHRVATSSAVLWNIFLSVAFGLWGLSGLTIGLLVAPHVH